MIDHNQRVREKLLDALNHERAVLIVGAGSSKIIGYPLWSEFIETLHASFAPSLPRPAGSWEDAADEILQQIRNDNNENAYFNLVERTFQPRDGANYDGLHLVLVQLGFSGIVTTNYDEVIEYAVREIAIRRMMDAQCDPIDLCAQRPYRVSEFLRGLGGTQRFRWVLHLHGHYRYPKQLILTAKDYVRHYGEVPSYDEGGRPMRKALATLHRKVLWTLLATCTLVFVGFSLSDRFFLHLMRVVQDDFELGSDPTHFGIFPLAIGADLEMSVARFRNHGILPMFYEVPIDNHDDHRSLRPMIYELGRARGVSVEPARLKEISERMLES